MRFPWYRVVWNYCWVPFYFVGVVICSVAVGLNKLSLKRGLEHWRESW